MTSVTLDGDTASKLTKAGTLVEVKNAAGEIVGYFAPPAVDRAASYAAAAAAAHLYYRPGGTNGEPTYSTSEVLAHLDSLGSR